MRTSARAHFLVRKLSAGWALGPYRLLGLALYSLVARLTARVPKWPEETRDFVVSVVTAGGKITSSRDPAGTIRVEQRLSGIQAPLVALIRPATSDVAVWNQVVRDRQYSPVIDALAEAGAAEVKTILDLGANIGLTTTYFGAVYPNARILAVEPDPGSFHLLKRNAEMLGGRVLVRRAAFWPRQEPLGWTSAPFRDGREWARAVEQTGGGAGTIDVITPAEALTCLNVERADLAKIDIEGAEAVFFATEGDTEALLGLANVIAIELHGESVDFLKAAMAFDHAELLTVHVGDFVIAIRRDCMAQRAPRHLAAGGTRKLTHGGLRVDNLR